MSQYLSAYIVDRFEDFDCWNPDFDKLPKKLPKATILEYVKEVIQYRGLGYIDGWSDHLDWEDTEKLSEWARGIVLRAFPELNKPA